MLLNERHKDFAKVKLLDCTGNEIPWVCEYDTETKVAKLCFQGKRPNSIIITNNGEGGTPAMAIVELPGSYLVFRDTGKVYKG